MIGSVEIIKQIYKSEIPCRLEWFFDAGFTWSIQDGSCYPRIMKDDDIDGENKIVWESSKNILERNNPLFEKDWLVRGCNQDFDIAIKELAEAICHHEPGSGFAQWYDNIEL